MSEADNEEKQLVEYAQLVLSLAECIPMQGHLGGAAPTGPSP